MKYNFSSISETMLKLLITLTDAFLISWLVQFVLLGKPCLTLPATILTFLLILHSPLRKIGNTLGILFAFLYPISRTLQDGLLQWASVEVLFTTNFDEALGFQQSLPSTLYLHTLGIILIFLSLLVSNKKLQICWLKKEKLIISVCSLLVFPWFCYAANVVLTPRINEMISSYNDLISKPQLKESQWRITGRIGRQYSKYVVIIGESMRRDLMSLYGFPLKTTPMLDKFPKQTISNFVSPAPYTIISVPRLLSIVDTSGCYDEQNNAVSLARKAGFKTSWISAQGYTGQWNLGPKIIANYADEQHFSAFGSDELLLPKIEETLKKNEKQLVFIHIIGSHENPCHRLGNYKNKYSTNNGGGILTCYLSTYNRTDEFIAHVIALLKNNAGKDWSLMYFSDHGLNFHENNGSFSFMRDPLVKQSYEVPFVVISGDETENHTYNVLRSGNNLIKYFPTWIGVTTNLTPDNYDIFTAPNDKPQVMSYDEKLMDYTELRDSIKAEDVIRIAHPREK